MKLVIGLVGEKGSGKETFGKILKAALPQKKIVHIRFSDILKDTLNLWDLPLTRENLQDLAIIMDKHYGKGTLTHALHKKILDLEADIVLLDGVRWPTDVELIKSFKKNLIIYITADLKIRYERLKIRGEKHGEAESFKQFMKEEKKPNEIYIYKIGKKANIKIENNGSLEEFKKEIISLLSELS